MAVCFGFLFYCLIRYKLDWQNWEYVLRPLCGGLIGLASAVWWPDAGRVGVSVRVGVTVGCLSVRVLFNSLGTDVFMRNVGEQPLSTAQREHEAEGWPEQDRPFPAVQ